MILPVVRKMPHIDIPDFTTGAGQTTTNAARRTACRAASFCQAKRVALFSSSWYPPAFKDWCRNGIRILGCRQTPSRHDSRSDGKPTAVLDGEPFAAGLPRHGEQFSARPVGAKNRVVLQSVSPGRRFDIEKQMIGQMKQGHTATKYGQTRTLAEQQGVPPPREQDNAVTPPGDQPIFASDKPDQENIGALGQATSQVAAMQPIRRLIFTDPRKDQHDFHLEYVNNPEIPRIHLASSRPGTERQIRGFKCIGRGSQALKPPSEC